jgi:chromosome segregation ATPase
MFFKKAQRIAALENELSAARSREQALSLQIDQLRAAQSAYEQAASDKNLECDTLKAILRNLAMFGDTLSGSQISLAQMANSRKKKSRRSQQRKSRSAAARRPPKSPRTCINWRKTQPTRQKKWMRWRNKPAKSIRLCS